MHRDVIGTLGDLCTETISDVETQLAKQKVSDEAEVQRLIEEERQKVEAMRLAAEQAEKDRAEKMRKVEEETQIMEAMQRDLDAKQALREAQKAANIFVDDNNDNNDVACVSTVGEQVHSIFNVIYHPILTIVTESVRVSRRK
jgi:hypothetical protein